MPIVSHTSHMYLGVGGVRMKWYETSRQTGDRQTGDRLATDWHQKDATATRAVTGRDEGASEAGPHAPLTF